MALDGSTWDEVNPTDATVAVQIDDYMRDLRIGIRSRLAGEHEFPSSQSATSQAGSHKFVTLQNQATQPTLAGTQIGVVYSKLATTNYELYFARTGSNAGEVQITVGTGINTPGISFDGVTINTNTAGALMALTVTNSGIGASQLSAAFSAWAGVNNNQVYHATSDGFVWGLGGASTAGYTDSSNPPTTQRYLGYYSIAMPVRKGDYWKVTGCTAVYWLPLGS